MRSVLAGGSLLLGLAYAAPTPQDIDIDLAIALPNPTYTTTLSVVTYDATSILLNALPQITSSATDDSLALSTDAPALAKRTACQTQPTGAGPVPSPDSPSAFLSYAPFASAATNAPVPSGYSQTFSNLQGSNNAYGYMGYSLLQTYDTVACANKCNKINGCMAINIYYERDPTVEPATNCPNPASTTNIKCVFWGGPVGSDNAVNTGQYRSQFQVVIAGSNGYVNSSIATPAGYTTAVDLGNAAINAPYDVYGFDSFMGAAIFNSGPFKAQLCADACSTKSAYNLAHPPTDGSPVQTCQFFNTYILYVNNTSNLQGQYCAMYSESWPSSYATNVGQYRGNDHYMIEYSYMYSNATNPGKAAIPPAVHQASKDISYSTLQSFCSSYLGYSTPLATVSTTTTITPVSTVLSTTTVTTVVVNQKRTAAAVAAAALSTPNVLTKYPSAVLSSACSLQATPVTSTSTVVLSYTATAAASTTTVQVAATATATVKAATCAQAQALGNFAIQASYNSQFAQGGQGENSGVTFTATSASAGQAFFIDSNCVLTEASGQYALFQGNQDSGTQSENVYFNSVNSINGNGYKVVTCVADSSNALTCSAQGNAVSSESGDLWFLANTAANAQGTVITLTAVPISVPT